MNRFKIGNQFVLKLLNVAHLWSAATDPSELYENGIIDCLKVYFGEMSKVRKLDDQFLIETEIEMLKTLDNLLKYVSEFVKRALQAKKAAGSTDSLAQQAEKLLHVNKSLIGICTHLINMVFNFFFILYFFEFKFFFLDSFYMMIMISQNIHAKTYGLSCSSSAENAKIWSIWTT